MLYRLYAPSKEVEVGCFDSFVVFKGYGYCNNFNAWDSKVKLWCF